VGHQTRVWKLHAEPPATPVLLRDSPGTQTRGPSPLLRAACHGVSHLVLTLLSRGVV